MAAALVVSSALALTLAGVAWWALEDGSGGNDRLVSAIRAVNVVVLSKYGLKGILLAVIVGAAGVVWLRRRRLRRDATGDVPVGAESSADVDDRTR